MTAGARGGGSGESAIVPTAEAPAFIPKSSGLPPQPRNIGLVTTISSPDDAAIPGHSYTVSSLQNTILFYYFYCISLYFSCTTYYACRNWHQIKRESWRSTTIITKGEKGSQKCCFIKQNFQDTTYINLVSYDRSQQICFSWVTIQTSIWEICQKTWYLVFVVPRNTFPFW